MVVMQRQQTAQSQSHQRKAPYPEVSVWSSRLSAPVFKGIKARECDLEAPRGGGDRI